MEDKVRIKNLKSLFEFFEKFDREMTNLENKVTVAFIVLAKVDPFWPVSSTGWTFFILLYSFSGARDYARSAVASWT